MDCVVDGRPPFQTSAFQAMADGRQHDLLLAETREEPAVRSATRRNLRKIKAKRILHSKVWILFYLIKPLAHIANRHCRE